MYSSSSYSRVCTWCMYLPVGVGFTGIRSLLHLCAAEMLRSLTNQNKYVHRGHMYFVLYSLMDGGDLFVYVLHSPVWFYPTTIVYFNNHVKIIMWHTEAVTGTPSSSSGNKWLGIRIIETEKIFGQQLWSIKGRWRNTNQGGLGVFTDPPPPSMWICIM